MPVTHYVRIATLIFDFGPSTGRAIRSALAHVRFGSEADICSAKGHVRFTPNSERDSGHAANGRVCFTPQKRTVKRALPSLLSQAPFPPTTERAFRFPFADPKFLHRAPPPRGF